MSKQSEAEIRQGYIPKAMPHTCVNCGFTYTINRDDIHYWPDALWPGKIQAHSRCPDCLQWGWSWAHELPGEWQNDVKRFDWDMNMRRLLCSMQFHHIQPHPCSFNQGLLKRWFHKLIQSTKP